MNQVSDYESTTEFLINYIKKTLVYGMDIGRLLETLPEIDLNQYTPSLSISLSTDEGIKMVKGKQKENKH